MTRLSNNGTMTRISNNGTITDLSNSYGNITELVSNTTI